MKKLAKIICFLLFITAIFSFSVVKPSTLICKVENHLGAPTLMINGEPTVPFMFYGYAKHINKDSNFVVQATLATNAGVHIYSFHVPMIWKDKDGYSTLYKIIDDKNHYAPLDKVLDNVIKFDKDALIIPRFYLHPPIWWLNKYPETKMFFSDGEHSRVSLASKKWQKYVATSVKAFVNHCEKKYGNHIIGYHPTMLNTGECFYERAWEKVFSGFSKPMNKGFAEWVRNKYKTKENLRAAWKNNDASFSNIKVPSVKQRQSSVDNFFRDPVNDKFLIDFFEYQNDLVADTINFIAAIIKNQTKNNKITVFFYGYSFELSAIPNGVQTSGHLALKKLLSSKNIDVICAPIGYSNRRAGGLAAFMAPVDSISSAGKLWINEDDTRTYLCKDPQQLAFSNIKNLQENLWIYNQHFARIYPRRMGTWFMDLFNKAWLNSPGIWQHIAKLKNIYQNGLNVTSTWNPEVAVIVDERSPLYLACNNELTFPLYSGMRSQFYRMGAPFNLYLLSDVLSGKVKLRKVNIFIGAWYLEKAERAKLISALKNKTAVWFYGAGYMDETGASKNNISRLTGFNFKELKNKKPIINFTNNATRNINLTRKSFSPQLYGGMDIKTVYQTYNQPITYKKIWAVKRENGAIPLAYYDDGTIALAKREYSGYNSIYCGITGLPAQFLRNVLLNSGVHIYINSDNMVEADKNFIAVGVYEKKTEKILLHPKKYLINLLDGQKLIPKNNAVNDNFNAGETKLYKIKNLNNTQ